MKTIPLGRTGLNVSAFCLGSMTWGSQNTEAEGHAQLDMALDRGVFFWDTAEIYPVNPVRAETVGRTEDILGSWFASRGRRDAVVLATKIAGTTQDAVRGGAPISRATMRAAVEGSLRRLRTDHIDLYQLHKPNRAHYHFRNNWHFDPSGADPAEIEDNMLEVLEAAGEMIAEGKIGHVGLSNESVWGAAKWLALADRHGLPRMETIQNEYSLLCRLFDGDWAELSVMENLPLMAYSPLAAGILSGKYRGDATPAGSRRSINGTLSGRITPRMFPAAEAYFDIAARHGLDPVAMAIAFVRSRPFPAIPILGATSLDQLQRSLAAEDLELAPEVLAEIEAAHRAHPLPF